MKRFEYRLFRLAFKAGSTKDDQMLEALNRFGQDGWRLNRMYGDFGLRSLSTWHGAVNFILERAIGDDPLAVDQTATAFQEIGGRGR
jgi:hypothetical protein